jgi:glycosyltransferase involved in cell wall biosynthesis
MKLKLNSVARPKTNKIIYVDYGSQDTSGFYIERILNAYNGPIQIEAFVHSKFPESSAKAKINRLFAKRIDLFRNKIALNIYKTIDLYVCFFILLYKVYRYKNIVNLVVNVSVYQYFQAYEFLFKHLCRMATLVVTVHDAVELKHSYPTFLMSDQKSLFKYADLLWVHSKDSVNILGYLNKPTFFVPFPLMKTKKKEYGGVISNQKIKLLFLGHIRQEKGLDILLKAWRKLPKKNNHVELTVAGSIDPSLEIDFGNLNNVNLDIGYLDEFKFMNYLHTADVLIFPYTGGTNSGVYSMANSLCIPSITSSLPIFEDSDLFIQELSFSTESELIEIILNLKYDSVLKYHHKLSEMADIYDREFDAKIEDAYTTLFM